MVVVSTTHRANGLITPFVGTIKGLIIAHEVFRDDVGRINIPNHPVGNIPFMVGRAGFEGVGVVNDERERLRVRR